MLANALNDDGSVQPTSAIRLMMVRPSKCHTTTAPREFASYERPYYTQINVDHPARIFLLLPAPQHHANSHLCARIITRMPRSPAADVFTSTGAVLHGALRVWFGQPVTDQFDRGLAQNPATIYVAAFFDFGQQFRRWRRCINTNTKLVSNRC